MSLSMAVPIKKPSEVCDQCWSTAQVTLAGILVPPHCRDKVRCVYSLVKYAKLDGVFMFVLEQQEIR